MVGCPEIPAFLRQGDSFPRGNFLPVYQRQFPFIVFVDDVAVPRSVEAKVNPENIPSGKGDRIVKRYGLIGGAAFF
jgi:hypothetical protein